LPEPHTDFIFAVTAENSGFIGCVSLLIAYALLLSRMIAGARQSSDRAGMLVIMSVVSAMAFQIFMNIGMAQGFLPVIGSAAAAYECRIVGDPDDIHCYRICRQHQNAPVC
jgi:rod shape determining protein RodA